MQNHLRRRLPGIDVTEIALAIDKIIRQHLIVDWQYKTDVQNKMKQAIDE